MTDEEFEKFINDIRDCKFFASGYKCNIDCNSCPFALDNGRIDWKTASKKCKNFEMFAILPVDMTDEEWETYHKLTSEQKIAYKNILGVAPTAWEEG